MLLPLVLAMAPLQGTDDPPRPKLPNVVERPQATQLLNVDGAPLVAGALPESTSAEARALCARLFSSTWTGEGLAPPMRAFVVTFDARVRAQVEGGATDVRMRFQFLEEGRGWIRGVFPRTGRESVRGPEGDWLKDGDEVLDLSDHSNAESRREHERWLALARNFAVLSSPTTLRIVEARAAASVTLEDGELRVANLRIPLPNGKLGALAQNLEWLVIRSPEFDLLESAESTRSLKQVALGLDPDSGAVRLAHLAQDPGAAGAAPEVTEEGSEQGAPPEGTSGEEAGNSLWVEVRGWSASGSRRLPKQLLVHREAPRSPARPGLRYEDRAGIDLFLIESGTFADANLRADDFARPTKKQD